MLKPYFGILKNNQLITENECKRMSKAWKKLIKETNALVDNLKIIENPLTTTESLIVLHQKTFSSKNYQKYLDAHNAVILKLSIHEKLLEIEKTPKGEPLAKTFDKNPATHFKPTSFSIMPIQRLPRHQMLMEDLGRNINAEDPAFNNALIKIVNNLKSTILVMNDARPH